MSSPEVRARNTVWRDGWALAERMELAGHPDAARMLREYLKSKGIPRPAGRPRSKGWVAY